MRCLIPAVLALLLNGCHDASRKTIAVVPKATSHMFWQSVQAGANAAGREFKVNVLWNGAAVETDFSRQIQIVDSMIARRVDGIAVAASDRNALSASLDRAAQAGIPVTIFDSGVDSGTYMTFLATNNYKAGEMAGQKLAQLIGGQGKVAMVLNMPGSRSSMEREKAFEDVIRTGYPGIRIVARQYGMADRSKAMAAAENMLTANPDLAGIFGSTEPSSTGAALAIKERGLSGKVKLLAFDASDQMIEDLRGGTITALVAQDPFRIGYEAVRTLVDRLHGKVLPKQIDLNAVVVTAADLDKPEIKKLLSPDIRKYLD